MGYRPGQYPNLSALDGAFLYERVSRRSTFGGIEA